MLGWEGGEDLRENTFSSYYFKLNREIHCTYVLHNGRSPLPSLNPISLWVKSICLMTKDTTSWVDWYQQVCFKEYSMGSEHKFILHYVEGPPTLPWQKQNDPPLPLGFILPSNSHFTHDHHFKFFPILLHSIISYLLTLFPL